MEFSAMLRPLISRLSAAAAICLLAGCGSTDGRSHVAPVKGKVTFKGEPLRTGSIIFVPDAGGKTAVADISREGEYVLGSYDATDGAIPGKHRIMIIALTAPGGTGLPEDTQRLKGGAQSPVNILPEKFSDDKKSMLVAEVKDGDNTIDIVLNEKTGEVKHN
jgi:hypothetical protein